MSDATLPTKESEQSINVDDNGGLSYGSAAESGHIEIEVPALRGSPNATERMHARDFGPFTAAKIQSALDRQGYLRSGPQQSPPQVLRHFVAVSRGAKLLDGETQLRFEKLSRAFEQEPRSEVAQAAYFRELIRPFLLGLSPKRR